MLKRMSFLIVVLILPAQLLLAETLRVKSRTRVWYGPDKITRIVGSLTPGTTVESLTHSGDWWKVRLPDGEVGYIPAIAVEVVDAGPPTQVVTPAPVPAPPTLSATPSAPPAPAAPEQPMPPRAVAPAPPQAQPEPPIPPETTTPPPATATRPVTPAVTPRPVPPQAEHAKAPHRGSAQSRTRFKVLIDGLFAQSLDYGETRTFEEFVESGSTTIDYSNDAGPGFGAAFQATFTTHFGVRAAFTYAKRDGTAHYEASFPHPLYFDHHRQVAGDVSGLSYNETSGHLDLVATTGTRSLTFDFFAGGSVIKVEADLLDAFTKTEVYPFDQTTVTGVSRTTVSDTPFGFNAGAGVDWRISDRVALGVQILYSRAKAKLQTHGGEFEIDAGGAHAGGGIRFTF